MSGHDDQIGQEWTEPRTDPLTLLRVIREQIGDDPALLRRVLAFFAGYAPEVVMPEVYRAAHEDGRHSGGRCPEQCPSF